MMGKVRPRHVPCKEIAHTSSTGHGYLRRSCMKATRIPPTAKTPAVELDPDAGLLVISGCSVHENADGFYAPIYRSLEEYVRTPATNTLVQVALTYFNSTSAKYLLDILRLLEDLHVDGRSRVRMEWSCAEDDLDMEEAGNDYRQLLEFPVKVIARPV